MSARILNRGQAAPPTDGWYQIEVTGTHPAGTDKHPQRQQVLDATALESIVNRFNADKTAAGDGWAGLLVDADHLSNDLDQRTEAMAWAQELRIENGQLQARLDLSDLGDSAIRNKRYKFFSTEYDAPDLETLPNGDVRPLRLSGLAFTNRPNNRGGKPISNRSGGTAPGGLDEPTTKPPMQSIAKALGLPDAATEADILAAITKLQSDKAGAEAEGVMNRLSNRIPADQKDHWRAALIKNRADTEKLLEGLPEIKAAATTPAKPAEPAIHNRGGKTTPADPTRSKESDTADRLRLQNEAIDSIRNRRPGTGYQEARNRARVEKPELFQSASSEGAA